MYLDICVCVCVCVCACARVRVCFHSLRLIKAQDQHLTFKEGLALVLNSRVHIIL